MKRVLYLGVVVGLVSFTLAGGGGCTKRDSSATKGEAAPPPTVKVKNPTKGVVHQIIEQPAYVEAFEETPLHARISGYVHKVHVDIGDIVRGPRYDDKGELLEPGQALAELWVPEMEQEARQKEALVQQAKAEVLQSVAIQAAAESNVDTFKALKLEAEAGRERADALYERWQLEYKRTEGLAGTVLDKQTLEEARYQFKAAAAARKEVEAKVASTAAGIKESEARRDKAKADLEVARAKVLVATADAARVRALVDYATVRAPYGGVITVRNIHTGHFLTGAGVKPLFVIDRTDNDRVRIVAEVPETMAMYVNDKTTAHIRFPVLKGMEQEAKLTRLSWALDAKARTLRVEIDLPNKVGKLRPGIYAHITLRAPLAETLTLPVGAVITQGVESVCYLLEKGKAVRTPIKIGAREGESVQVLKKLKGTLDKGTWEDFTGKEEVIVSSPGMLADGQAVIVEEHKH